MYSIQSHVQMTHWIFFLSVTKHEISWAAFWLLGMHIPFTPRNSSIRQPTLPWLHNIHWHWQQYILVLHLAEIKDIWDIILLLTSYATNEWPYLADGPWCFSLEAWITSHRFSLMLYLQEQHWIFKKCVIFMLESC